MAHHSNEFAFRKPGGFGATQSNSVVTFYGGAQAQILSWSDTEITAVVPGGTVTGPVTVKVGGVSADSPGSTGLR